MWPLWVGRGSSKIVGGNVVSPFWRTLLLATALTLAFTAGRWCGTEVVRADSDPDDSYTSQTHDGIGGSADGRIIYDLWERIDGPNIPAAMVPGTVTVIQCESRWDTNAVGAAGELGVLQIHPIHKEAMRSLGLEYNREGDRIEFAVRLWRNSGNSWRSWSCQP
jgi:hypothetical protein